MKEEECNTGPLQPLTNAAQIIALIHWIIISAPSPPRYIWHIPPRISTTAVDQRGKKVNKVFSSSSSGEPSGQMIGSR